VKRVILLILVLSGILGKDLASFSWNVWFYTNQKRIAAEKCENKAKPMMHCDGKCYLSKQLKKLDQEEKSHNQKQNPFQKLEKMELLPLVIKVKPVVVFADELTKNHFYYELAYNFKLVRTIEKPPTILFS
jgi:hypothetical protein